MILGVNYLTAYGRFANQKYNINKKVEKNVSFQASPAKMLRNAGMALAAATMLSAVSSCNFVKQKTPDDIELNSASGMSENNSSASNQCNNTVYKSYHYFPKENDVRADNYDWSETIYPDGRIEKDSLGYKIYVSPNKERTVIKTDKDESGNITVIKQFSNGTKFVRTDYKTNVINEVLYVETNYWSNGKIKERHFYNEYPTKEQEPYGERVIEESIYKYNENEDLLMWESSQVDSFRSEANNKYDKKGRLIYDDVKNEKYRYKRGATKPYQAVSELDGCKRIKLYNTDGSIQSEYFIAKDGTKTLKEAQ